MLEFGTITLFREKSVVYRFIDTNDDEGPREQPVMELRSNRVTIPVKTKLSTVSVVVRGQNIPGSMRMTGIALDEIRRDANVLVDGGGADWHGAWERKVSKYERDYNPQNWASVHVGGDQLFSSRDDNKAIQEIESLALATEVTDDMVIEAASNVLGALDDYAVEHDSQTAFVMVPGAQYHRASILERRDRKTGAFSMSAFHPSPQQPVRLSYFMGFCADMMEILTLKSFLERVQEMAADGSLGKSSITPTQVQGARLRRKELQNAIEDFEKVTKLAYRPDRPNLT
jgi:hypothetical protein